MIETQVMDWNQKRQATKEERAVIKETFVILRMKTGCFIEWEWSRMKVAYTWSSAHAHTQQHIYGL